METEWIVLADHAEVINGKLYLMGGGWEALTVNSLPAQHRCAVAVAFSVPWNETNQRHAVEVAIATNEGKVLTLIDAQIEIGRPPGIPLGSAQRVPLAANLVLTIEDLGGYVVSTKIEGQSSRTVPFRVLAGPALAR